MRWATCCSRKWPGACEPCARAGHRGAAGWRRVRGGAAKPGHRATEAAAQVRTVGEMLLRAPAPALLLAGTNTIHRQHRRHAAAPARATWTKCSNRPTWPCTAPRTRGATRCAFSTRHAAGREPARTAGADCTRPAAGQFLLLYQAQVDETGRMTGAEVPLCAGSTPSRAWCPRPVHPPGGRHRPDPAAGALGDGNRPAPAGTLAQTPTRPPDAGHQRQCAPVSPG
jgi:hypothetical protein